MTSAADGSRTPPPRGPSWWAQAADRIDGEAVFFGVLAAFFISFVGAILHMPEREDPPMAEFCAKDPRRMHESDVQRCLLFIQQSGRR